MGVAVGEDILAAHQNIMLNRPIIRLAQQAAQSLANATNVALTFGSGSEEIDTHSFHDVTTNNSRITPTADWAGYYQLEGTLWLSAATLNDQTFQIFIAKNGATVFPGQRLRYTSGTSIQRSISVRARLPCDGLGDYFEVLVNQQSGGALNTQVTGGIASVFEAEFLRPL